MRVSLVIPCFKDSATLGRALDSVFAQSRAADEVIVVNDASPETSEIEVVLFAYPSVKYVVNEVNLGLAATRNAGAHAATGEIVCFLDADDELHPQKIELQLSLYRPERAVSCSVERIGDERGIDRVAPYPGEVKYSVLADSSVLIRRNTLTGASLMVSRELFLSLGGYDETLRSCEDFDLWLRLIDAGVPAFNIDLPLYLYRVNEKGLSKNLLSISYWELEVVKKHYARHRCAGNAPLGEATTLMIWLFKHFVRFEQCRDPKLMEATRRNLELLNVWPFARALLLVAQKIGLPRLTSFLLATRGSSGVLPATFAREQK
jgi:glycosyltransferase involved in cell wall biosynthesis